MSEECQTNDHEVHTLPSLAVNHRAALRTARVSYGGCKKPHTHFFGWLGPFCYLVRTLCAHSFHLKTRTQTHTSMRSRHFFPRERAERGWGEGKERPLEGR